MMPVWKTRSRCLRVLQRISENENPLESDSISIYIAELEELLTDIDNFDFTINSRTERGFIIQMFNQVRMALD